MRENENSKKREKMSFPKRKKKGKTFDGNCPLVSSSSRFSALVFFFFFYRPPDWRRALATPPGNTRPGNARKNERGEGKPVGPAEQAAVDWRPLVRRVVLTAAHRLSFSLWFFLSSIGWKDQGIFFLLLEQQKGPLLQSPGKIVHKLVKFQWTLRNEPQHFGPPVML